jgi:Cdc6-like AAA superfamily ATPase
MNKPNILIFFILFSVKKYTNLLKLVLKKIVGIMKKNFKKTSKTIAGIIQSKSQYTELQSNELRWNCPEDIFEFKSTKEVEPLDTIVGQPRAIEAIKLGAELFTKGYNIFVSGLSGTGRLTTVKRMLEKFYKLPNDFDYCYVNNLKIRMHLA